MYGYVSNVGRRRRAAVIAAEGEMHLCWDGDAHEGVGWGVRCPVRALFLESTYSPNDRTVLPLLEALSCSSTSKSSAESFGVPILLH